MSVSFLQDTIEHCRTLLKALDYKEDMSTTIGGVEGNLTEYLKGKKVLILFDNVNSGDQVDLLLRCCEGRDPGSIILFTCRDSANLAILPAESKHQVDLLPEDAAFDFLCSKAGHGMVERESSLGKAISEAANACGGLPLALEIMGRYIRGKGEMKNWEVRPIFQ